MSRVAVVGAAGYTGIEAVRLVLSHDRLRLTLTTSAAEKGRTVSSVYPSLAGLTDLAFTLPDPDEIASAADVALLAVPHTAALELAPKLLSRGVTVIDLSADYRLQDARVYEDWYGTAHTSPELLPEAVFGLPELDRSRLPGARLVACPGCYPTATTLAALPALSAGLVTSARIVVDAKSGVSGAGRTASAGTHYVAVNEAVTPYKVAAHRHTPEIEQALSTAAGRQMNVVFAPHLVPMSRGLLSTVYLEIKQGVTWGTCLQRPRSVGQIARRSVSPWTNGPTR
jgi:N-acetyl-gamma-glutamyl-phosphate reductase